MSSFTTNRATRRGKKARTEGNSYRAMVHSIPVPESLNLLHNKGQSQLVRAPTLQTTVIGGHHSKGITIVGGSAREDHTVGNNPDGRDIPFGTSGQTSGFNDDEGEFPNDTLVHRPHLISYTGPGYLKFESEVGIPSVRGHMDVNGDLHVIKDLVVDGSFSTGGGTNLSFTPVIQDASGNEFVMSVQYGRYTSILNGLTHMTIDITWTGKGAATTGPLYITGLPVFVGGGTSVYLGTSSGITTAFVGSQITLRTIEVPPGLSFEENDSTSGTNRVLESAQFMTTGRILFDGVVGPDSDEIARP